MKKFFALFLITAILQTASCNNLEQLASKEDQMDVGDFNSYLSRDYLNFARSAADNYSWSNSEYFSQKGLRVLRGDASPPENPEKWQIKRDKSEELYFARERLLLILIDPAKLALPRHLARLNFLYDCWVSQEEKAWQIGEVAKCKSEFFTLLDQAERYLLANNVIEEPKLPPPLEPTIEIVPVIEMTNQEKNYHRSMAKYEILFDANKVDLNKASATTISRLLQDMQNIRGFYELTLTGHADRKGSAKANSVISKRRVERVLEKLVSLGVDRNKIKTKYFGADRAKIATRKGMSEARNRRVEMELFSVITNDEDGVLLPNIPKPAETKKFTLKTKRSNDKK